MATEKRGLTRRLAAAWARAAASFLQKEERPVPSAAARTTDAAIAAVATIVNVTAAIATSLHPNGPSVIVSVPGGAELQLGPHQPGMFPLWILLGVG